MNGVLLSREMVVVVSEPMTGAAGVVDGVVAPRSRHINPSVDLMPIII